MYSVQLTRQIPLKDNDYNSFYYHDTLTNGTYTLSLHDALPICLGIDTEDRAPIRPLAALRADNDLAVREKIIIGKIDWMSTRLNSSYRTNWYAVFCLKKKKIYKLNGPIVIVHERRVIQS